MDENNKTSLYNEMRRFAQQFTYVYEAGVTIEIEEFFSHKLTDNTIKDFTLLFDNDIKHYKMIAILEEWSPAAIHGLFMSFFQFIAYSNTNIFVNKQTEQGIHYEFASFAETGRGFYCEIDFFPETATTKAEGNQQNDRTSHCANDSTSASHLQRPGIKWKLKMDCAGNFPLVAAQGIVYTVNMDETLYAVDAEGGILRWQWEPPDHDESYGRIVSSPRVDKGVLTIVVHYHQHDRHNASLYTMDAQTGHLLKHISIPRLQSCGTFNLLTVQDEIAYMSGAERGSHNPHCFCLAIDLQTGTCKWTVDLGEHIGTTTPVVANAHIYLVTLALQRRHLHALDAQTGKTIWTHTFERHQAQEITVIGTDIFIAGAMLEIIDATTGTKRWSFADPQRILNGPPVVNNERICISYEDSPSHTSKSEKREKSEIILSGGPSRGSGMIAVDRATMQLQWIIPLPQWTMPMPKGRSFPTGVSISNEVLYTTWVQRDIRGITTHATLFALNVRTGEEYWRFDSNDLSAPFAEHSVVFVQGSEDDNNYLYALHQYKL
jgi:outer membrane protein assembly factor BamB